MDQTDYTFLKETIFNNNGAFGSDLTRYKLFRNGVCTGDSVMDLYYSKTLITIGEERYRISNKLFSGTGLYNDKTGEKIAGISLASRGFNPRREGSLKFKDGAHFKLLLEDFSTSKSYQTRLYSHDTDVLFDFTVLLPRKEFTMLREIPLEGEISITGTLASPQLALFGLSLMERLIVFIEQQNRA